MFRSHVFSIYLRIIGFRALSPSLYPDLSPTSSAYLIHHALSLDAALPLEDVGYHRDAHVSPVPVCVRHTDALCLKLLLNFCLPRSTANVSLPAAVVPSVSCCQYLMSDANGVHVFAVYQVSAA